ncbi:hypothetical protein HOR11_gp084 [Lactobacillus phage SA-C12]|uniref:Uncharacterized protein n=1 Tax=Lactobacillus phage SA-C12 TaxID=1755697 RepID=A0A1I9KKB0_9CAUD|nr:hypothetical protein HOR11_gp084 [Lactobacillus phage SA-C12]ALY06905.1 hypothetical protein SAC12_084 [Lactobacillus phage SA-C12]
MAEEKIIPEHYQHGGKDLLDHMEKILTEDEMRGAYKFNIFKYADRAGKKDNVNVEIGKIIEYAKRWRNWENSLKGGIVDNGDRFVSTDDLLKESQKKKQENFNKQLAMSVQIDTSELSRKLDTLINRLNNY